VPRLRTGRRGFDSWLWQGYFLFATASRPSLWSTRPPIQRYLGQNGRGAKLAAYLQLMSRFRNAWDYTSTPQYSFISWCSFKAQGQHNLIRIDSTSTNPMILHNGFTALLNYWLSPWRRTRNSHSAGQEIHNLSCSPNVH